jgi:hypothetical protein
LIPFASLCSSSTTMIRMIISLTKNTVFQSK